MRKRREKIGEIAISVVAPMKLHTVASDQARGFAFIGFIIADEQYVQRRKAPGLDLRQGGIEHSASRVGVRGQQPGTGYRCKRDRCEELRVITPSVTSIGIGPAPIENIFAVAVHFRIKRHRADQDTIAPRGHETRLPAGLSRRTARLVQCREERVREERVAWGERIPCAGIDGGERHIAPNDGRARNGQWHG